MKNPENKNQEVSQEIRDLKQLVEFLKEQQVAEFDLDRGELKLRLKFAQPPAPVVAHMIPATPQAPAAAVPHFAMPAAPPAAPPASAPVAGEDPNLHIVKSPIVGTFYGSPSPGAPPFVSPGDRVDKGTIICIVEAMKLMNEIESDAAGEIVKCLVTNGQPIEFGQPLFAIKTA
jgi:acetyl-CoA carboxylase biotin carboxyl carrier protein